MSSAVRPAAGLELFALDDGGVLYASEAQELHALNPVATYLWLVVENGASASELASALAERFELDAAKAYAWVEQQLTEWRLRGWVAEAPRAKGQTRSSREGRPRLPRTKPPSPRRERPHASGGRLRHYRLLTTRFDIVTEPGVDAHIAAALSHLECPADGAVDVLLELQAGADGYVLFEDGSPVERGCAADAVTPIVKMHLRRLATDRHAYFMQIHAGAVLTRDGCLLFPGEAGSGKTTLTAGLAAAGFGYLSDEIALLEHDTLAVRPVPLALTVKPGAVGPLAELYPELDSLPVHRREDGKRVRYLTPPRVSAVPDREEGYPVRALVFPQHVPGSQTELRTLGRTEAVQRLLSSCVTLPEWLSADRVENLVRFMRRLECWELQTGGLADAVATVRKQLGPA